MLIANTLSRSTLKSAAVSEATWDNKELIAIQSVSDVRSS